MVPSCLVKLKTVQIEHMELVIQTLLAFMGGTDLQTLEPVLARARQKDDEYALEVARLLGLTVVPATAPPLPLETPTPTP